MLKINEIFDTVQGEAFYTGTPATFIRLQGCPVGCHWCDTKHTWSTGTEKLKIEIDEMLHKTKESPKWSDVSEKKIVNIVTKLKPRHFVLTGGEPCSQDIFELTRLLASVGSVQVETSGTHTINVYHKTWVTVSPKIDMMGGLNVLNSALIRANELKMPINGHNDVKNLEKLVKNVNYSQLVWLQPVSQKQDNTDLCVKTAMDNNWRISIQTHKYMGVR
jgi:7-carboxy-7-deazaguanine synthase